MDALAGLLDGPRARGAFLLRTMLSPPWSIRIQDRAPLSIAAFTRGDAWILPGVGEPVRVREGDIMVARGPDAYTVADDPSTPPQIIIHPGQHCTTPDGRELSQALDLGVRSWGTDPDGPVVALVGSYESTTMVGRRLLSSLPPLLVLPEVELESPIVALLANEIVKDDPGQDVVLDRLLDLLVIAVLREWFSRPNGDAPGWYAAYADPVVGRALRMLHHNPANDWTVASLATETGVSRAALARRFTELVGEPPMAYLTSWRLSLTADLLRDPSMTLDSVARRVGYGSAFALSAAFKRVHGVSPQHYRDTLRAGAA
jgi:AraC-like DNA-binding protein